MGNGLNLALQGLAVAVLLVWAVARVWRARPQSPAAAPQADCGGCKGCGPSSSEAQRKP